MDITSEDTNLAHVLDLLGVTVESIQQPREHQPEPQPQQPAARPQPQPQVQAYYQNAYPQQFDARIPLPDYDIQRLNRSNDMIRGGRPSVAHITYEQRKRMYREMHRRAANKYRDIMRNRMRNED